MDTFELVYNHGKILAGPDHEGECILTADMDMDEIARGKYSFDVVGLYARPDVFRLHVNDRPKPSVVYNSETSVSEHD